MMRNKINSLDKVIIILSFLHKNDDELLRNFFQELTVNDIDRQKILDRINQEPSYHIEDIQEVLKEFYQLSQNDALFNLSTNLTTEIQYHVTSSIEEGARGEVESFFGGIPNNVLFEFLNNQGIDVKGLLCHLLPFPDLKKLFNILPADDVGEYLKAYHDVTPLNRHYLESFGRFLFKTIEGAQESVGTSESDKDSQFIQMLEILGNDALYKIENIE